MHDRAVDYACSYIQWNTPIDASALWRTHIARALDRIIWTGVDACPEYYGI